MSKIKRDTEPVTDAMLFESQSNEAQTIILSGGSESLEPLRISVGFAACRSNCECGAEFGRDDFEIRRDKKARRRMETIDETRKTRDEVKRGT